jgi:LPS sulfotransferase NodH
MAQQVSARRSYLVCGSPRCGSTLLCRALDDTGLAGRPDEYFLAVEETAQSKWLFWERGPFGVANGAQDRAHYLEIVLGLGTTPNGVFGAKLMWHNLAWAVAKFRELPAFEGLDRAATFRAALPNLQRAVHITRRDRVRQAISWARMAQDGVWVVSDDEPANPSGSAEYRFELISAMEQQIRDGEDGWRQLFAELDIKPHDVVYEDLVDPALYEAVLQGVLGYLGLDHRVSVPRPRTRRQSDETNERWLRRYRADLEERGGLGALAEPLLDRKNGA